MTSPRGFMVDGSFPDEACGVCLEDLNEPGTVFALPCLHRFHKDCIVPWVRRAGDCALCRSPAAA